MGPQSQPIVLPGYHYTAENVHRYREDNGAVVLCRDAVQCLQVSQLGEKKLYAIFILFIPT